MSMDHETVLPGQTAALQTTILARAASILLCRKGTSHRLLNASIGQVCTLIEDLAAAANPRSGSIRPFHQLRECRGHDQKPRCGSKGGEDGVPVSMQVTAPIFESQGRFAGPRPPSAWSSAEPPLISWSSPTRFPSSPSDSFPPDSASCNILYRQFRNS